MTRQEAIAIIGCAQNSIEGVVCKSGKSKTLKGWKVERTSPGALLLFRETEKIAS